MLQYGTGRYGGYAAPYTPFRRNRVAIVYRVARFLPSSRHYSRSAPYGAQPDCFQRKSGSTLRVMSTLVCQSDLSGLRSGSA